MHTMPQASTSVVGGALGQQAPLMGSVGRFLSNSGNSQAIKLLKLRTETRTSPSHQKSQQQPPLYKTPYGSFGSQPVSQPASPPASQLVSQPASPPARQSTTGSQQCSAADKVQNGTSGSSGLLVPGKSGILSHRGSKERRDIYESWSEEDLSKEVERRHGPLADGVLLFCFNKQDLVTHLQEDDRWRDDRLRLEQDRRARGEVGAEGLADAVIC